MNDGPLSPNETRDLLARLSHMPKKWLGQNFLIDGNIVRKSLELGEVKAGDTVVEVGPGLGTLTRTLLCAGVDLYAVEADRIGLVQGDLFAPLTGRRYDLIITNPPYVGAQVMSELPPEYAHEPEMALASGEGRLALMRAQRAERYRARVRAGGEHLGQHGHIEAGARQLQRSAHA